MENIENFFYQKIFFTKEEESFNTEDIEHFNLKTIYKSQCLRYPLRYNVYTLNKLIVEIRPFIKYLESNYSEK